VVVELVTRFPGRPRRRIVYCGGGGFGQSAVGGYV
jgi:hypothetical protein